MDDEVSTTAVRLAGAADLAEVADLLRAFNAEFDEPAPDAPVLVARLDELLVAGDVVLLIGEPALGEPALGVAVLRFRPSLWSAGAECYLAELYVVPAERGRGLGRALLTSAIQEARRRGADTMDLGTSEDDVAARALYESMGFTNREGPGGPVMYVYERELGSPDRAPPLGRGDSTGG